MSMFLLKSDTFLLFVFRVTFYIYVHPINSIDDYIEIQRVRKSQSIKSMKEWARAMIKFQGFCSILNLLSIL